MTKEERAKWFHECRPSVEDLKVTYGGPNKDIPTVHIRTRFPKKMPKGMYVVSDLGPVSFDAMIEYKILLKLKKPLLICAYSGRWEGTPFMTITGDDFEITEEDELLIEDYERDMKIRFGGL